ncbi:hypothetical protein [Neobacillus niacini]|uniref:hypothetical protein n=1 Tax=Neobacillus niacini TaxID=86668 RepID=UPI00203C564B|nr:hypothetical protein [Neobacillus niacini]MCM3693593.1 hypothetical protein [Neobacillus niacini]
MSLSKTSLLDNVKKQFTFKLKAYKQVFISLIFIQLLAVFFSFNGVGMMGSSSESIEIDIQFYSADMVIIFTIIWAFITAILITTTAYKKDDFTFVTNQLSSNLSNMLFLLTGSIVGGITAMLSTSLMKIIMNIFGGLGYISASPSLSEIVIGYSSTILYILLFSGLGYLFGTLVQISKAFAVLIPGVFIGAGILGAGSLGFEWVKGMYQFIFTEPSVLVFVLKVLVIVAMLFTSSIALSNRMEVRE